MFESNVLLVFKCDILLIFEPIAVELIVVEHNNVLMYGLCTFDILFMILIAKAFKVTKISTKLVRTKNVFIGGQKTQLLTKLIVKSIGPIKFHDILPLRKTN